jgi:protein-S-isoprenylcysteine O-methyltransferase Ste14
LVGLMGLRIAIQVRRTGSTGFRPVRGGPGTVEWWASVLLFGGILAASPIPFLILLGVLEPIAALDTTVVHALGFALAIAGMFLTFGAQMAMGDSWRVGVEPGERTDLVTSGPFRIIRNPIFGAIIPVGIGLTLLVPTVPSFLGLAAIATGLELQVRGVEEPYLLDAHGDAYRQYASRVGRFVPGIGLIKPATRGT